MPTKTIPPPESPLPPISSGEAYIIHILHTATHRLDTQTDGDKSSAAMRNHAYRLLYDSFSIVAPSRE
ncbi:MAG: hypothetical protein U0264_14315 [Candidatus Kapaibacterium sp.]